jgi:hypothetical protein
MFSVFHTVVMIAGGTLQLCYLLNAGTIGVWFEAFLLLNRRQSKSVLSKIPHFLSIPDMKCSVSINVMLLTMYL